MIVRIMADNQYHIADDDVDALGQIEALGGELEEAVEAEDAGAFYGTLARLIAHVRRTGSPLGTSELVPSDLIVPPANVTLEETKRALPQRTAAGS